MNIRNTNILRFDNIPADKFIDSIRDLSGSEALSAYLPDRKLNDVLIRFSGINTQGADDKKAAKHDFRIYLVMEDELIQKSRHRFIVFAADAQEEDNLTALAFQIRELLAKDKIQSFFRIDPLHGLVMGSTRNTIAPYFGTPSPKVCIVLYLVSEITHPGVATFEYVDRRYRREFIRVFKEINGTLPKRIPKFFDTQLFILKRKKEPSLLRHQDIETIVRYLVEQQYQDIMLSILYENLSQHEMDNMVFDTISASYLFRGQGKFFQSISDLLGN
jgi:hypothetical protein